MARDRWEKLQKFGEIVLRWPWGGYARELWQRKDVPRSGDKTDQALAESLADPLFPRPLGSPHPDPAAAGLIVTQLRLPRFAQGATAQAEVIFTSPGNGGGFPNLMAYGMGSTESLGFVLPIFTRFGDLLVGFSWDRENIYRQRNRNWRRHPHVVTSTDLFLKSDQIEAQLGKVFVFGGSGGVGGIPYVFAGYRLYRTQALGQFILVYEFWTTGIVDAIPADSLDGQSVALPALWHLSEYRIRMTTEGPIVTEATWEKSGFVAGDPDSLPFLD